MTNHIKSCFSCANLATGADGVRRCSIHPHGAPVSPDIEASCGTYRRETGSDDAVPEWYRDAWHVAGEGRGD